MVYSPTMPNMKLTAQDMGAPDYQAALQNAFKNVQDSYDTAYKPKNMAEALLQAQLKNKHDQIINQFLPEREQAEIANTQANTGLTGQNTYKQKILNSFLSQREPAEIAEIKSRSNYYNQGGSSSGVGSKNIQAFVNAAQQANPTLTPIQAQEAANVYAQGGTQLSDGTPLAEMTPLMSLALDNAVKSGSTAQGINQSNASNQADAELKAMSKLANQWAVPYGDTWFGKSTQQIVDSANPRDEAAQTRLGELIASNALQFEIAQIRNRIAGGQAGITSTNQMMDEAKQHIGGLWAHMTAKARQVANDRLNQGIEEGLAARNKGGYGAASTFSKKYEKDAKDNGGIIKLIWASNGNLVRG